MAVAPPTARKVDVAVIADAHLGSPRAKARELADYLESVDARTLVVAGDLLDLALLRSRLVPEDHLAVLRQLLELATSGTRVYLLSGNHDAALGRFGNFALGDLHVRRELELHLDGHRYLFCHGDRLEARVRLGLLTAEPDSATERAAAWADRQWGRILRVAGRPPRSLAHDLRRGGETARTMLVQYQLAAAHLALDRGCDTVVCAHVQQPAIAEVELPGRPERVRYLNPGDWVTNLTALEYGRGEWRLRYYDRDDSPPRSSRLRAPLPDREQRAERNLLEQIVMGGPTRSRGLS